MKDRPLILVVLLLAVALVSSVLTQSLRYTSTLGLGGEPLLETKKRNAVTRWDDLAVLERAWRTDSDQANHSQYFQTAQDRLEAYGPPTEIFRPTGGLLFCYRRHAEGSAGPAWYFRLQDGIVVEFALEDEKAEAE